MNTIVTSKGDKTITITPVYAIGFLTGFCAHSNYTKVDNIKLFYPCNNPAFYGPSGFSKDRMAAWITEDFCKYLTALRCPANND